VECAAEKEIPRVRAVLAERTHLAISATRNVLNPEADTLDPRNRDSSKNGGSWAKSRGPGPVAGFFLFSFIFYLLFLFSFHFNFQIPNLNTNSN
jgi:hypothetical protein